MPASFSTLFSASWTAFKARFKPLLIIAAVFGVILAVIQCIPLFVLTGGRTFDPSMAVFLLVYVLCMVVVGVIAGAATLSVCIEGYRSVGETLKRALALAFPLFMVGIWMLIKTYTWIPFVLLCLIPLFPSALPAAPLLMLVMAVLAVVFAPRYVLASVLLLSEKKDPRGAVQQSFTVTRGYWGKVVGNLLLLGIVLWVVMVAASIVLGVLGLDVPVLKFGADGMLKFASGASPRVLIGGIVSSVVSMLSQGFLVFFLVQLAQTLKAHPQKAAK